MGFKYSHHYPHVSFTKATLWHMPIIYVLCIQMAELNFTSYNFLLLFFLTVLKQHYWVW